MKPRMINFLKKPFNINKPKQTYEIGDFVNAIDVAQKIIQYVPLIFINFLLIPMYS